MNEITDNPEPISEPAATTEARPRRVRTLLIAGGAVLAATLLVAAGAAIAYDDDRDDVTQSELTGNDQTGGGSAAGAVGATSATQLLKIIETASTEVEGAPVDIEAVRGGGWDVEFETATGDESEVRVKADGTARIVPTETADPDDQAPTGQLDSATVKALVTAALDAVDGTITDLSVDNETVSPYSASVVTDNGRTVDIDLDAKFTVISTDIDTND